MQPIALSTPNSKKPFKQDGAALMVMLVIFIVGSLAIMVGALSRAGLQNERNKINADVLAKAKEALIGYAARDSNRPGDLPCPDVNDDGILTSTIDFNGSNCTSTIGRLPWKKLGLPELRDSAGEHLWYAVSKPFWDTQSTILNSDTEGTLTVRESSGIILNNGCTTGTSISSSCPTPNASDAPFGTGAVAVLFAPGEVLTRQGSSSNQDRSATGINIASNYLDTFTIGVNAEDNASITEGSSTKGFIQGKIKGSNEVVLVNDQLLVISQDNLMQSVHKRIANEVKNCLDEYANPLNGGVNRYPWAATFSSFSDTSSRLFGRIPDTPFTNTSNDSVAMNNTWVGNCKIISNSGWWLNWKYMVFYGLSDAYKPVNPASTTAVCSSASCLSINPNSPSADKKYVVIVAGKALPSQLPRNSVDPTTYLEGGNQVANQNGNYTFTQGAVSSTFNDTVIYK